MLRRAIVVIALLWLSAWACAAPQSPSLNLALNRPFATSCPTLPGWTGLVDGIKDSDSAPACFATANDDGFPKYVVIDLGADCTISKVVVYNSANGNTRTVALSCSTDGVTYRKLRDPDFVFEDQDAIALSVAFQPRQARYVRVSMLDTWKQGLGGDNCLFLREIEVFGSRGKETEESPFTLAAGQAPTVANRSLEIFRRYCLETPGAIKVTLVGDYFISGNEQDDHWARVAAEELSKFYPDKKITLTAVGGSDGAISFGLQWAQEHHGVLAPDIVLVSYGAQAANVAADIGEFRSKYQTLINELLDNTSALVIIVTPPPFLQNDRLAMQPKTKGQNTRSYSWTTEQLASALGVPLVRTEAVLARASGNKDLLYSDNMHLSTLGHRTLGLAIADLLHQGR